MFVFGPTYQRLLRDYTTLSREHTALLTRWNTLVEQINRKGGKRFLEGERNTQLSRDDVKRLLMLVHPDKHAGKPQAVEMTQKLLKLREAM